MLGLKACATPQLFLIKDLTPHTILKEVSRQVDYCVECAFSVIAFTLLRFRAELTTNLEDFPSLGDFSLLKVATVLCCELTIFHVSSIDSRM